MTRAWRTIATATTDEGRLELRRRGDADFLIVIDGRVLMTSAARRSEQALATLGLAPPGLPGAKRARAPRVLVGGLGMGFTLRAALDLLPRDASVVVAEITRAVVDWCRGPLAPLTGRAVDDPRVAVRVEDVARVIAAAPRGSFAAILLDLYEGPYQGARRRDDPIYGPTALARARAALGAGGALAIWAEEPDPSFPRRFAAAGFDVTTHRSGRGGRSHVVYLGISRG
jgi:spermidine synthase